MATTMYFEETIIDQGGKDKMDVEFGSSSFYDEPSIYLNVNGEGVIMDQATAKRFVNAVIRVGEFYGLVD
jgi:hypothetical protein